MSKINNNNVRSELSNFLKEKFGENTGRELFVEFVAKLDEFSNAERALMTNQFSFHEMEKVWSANCDLVEMVLKLLKTEAI
jgi:hypothetical protein